MAIHANRICRCCCDSEMVFGQPRRSTVIHGNSIFTQHQAIAGFTNIQLGKTIAVNFIQKGRGIAALHVNFAKRCDITDTDRRAGCCNFTINRLPPMRFSIPRKPLCPIPHAHLDKHRALFFCPFMARRLAYWPKIHIARPPSKYPDSCRAIGWPINCRASIRDRLTSGMRHNCQTQNIRCFALIGGHTQSGIAFKMFNRTEIFLMRQFDIFDRHIILLVNPTTLGPCHIPEWRERCRLI